jgi:hypothetical protein
MRIPSLRAGLMMDRAGLHCESASVLETHGKLTHEIN